MRRGDVLACGVGVDRKYGGVCHIDGMTQARADDIRGLCDKHGVGISAICYYASALSGDAAETETVRANKSRNYHVIRDEAPVVPDARATRATELADEVPAHVAAE